MNDIRLHAPYNQYEADVVQLAAGLLRRVGVNLNTPHTQLTPYRFLRYLYHWQERELPRFTIFENKDPKIDQLVVVSPIPFWSCCSHHMLPYVGVAHFGYIPVDKLVGLSKVPLLFSALTQRPSLQEHLTEEIADWFEEQLEPLGLCVVTTAMHTCQMLDLDGPPVPQLTFSALRGALFDNSMARAEFFSLIG